MADGCDGGHGNHRGWRRRLTDREIEAAFRWARRQWRAEVAWKQWQLDTAGA